MARKVTNSQLRQMVDELVAIKPVFDRFKRLEKQVREGMVALDLVGEESAIEVQAGRVFVTQSDRVTIPPELAEEILGALAEKVIVIRRSVPNKRVAELTKAGVISEEAFKAMEGAAEHHPIVSLYIRPLK